jgi:hypothetical protein
MKSKEVRWDLEVIVDALEASTTRMEEEML